MRDPTLPELFAFTRYSSSLALALEYLMHALNASGLPSDVVSALVQQCATPGELDRRMQAALREQNMRPSATLSTPEDSTLEETLKYIHERAMAGVRSGDVACFHEIAEAVESIEPSLERLPLFI